MNKKENDGKADVAFEEALSILASMKGILMLVEHYPNPTETTEYLTMLATCISRLEIVVAEIKFENRLKL
ncbi:MAG TPA: hypothetical protein VK666_14165 [Chryseolinea sp.]|nr:hypothetical protein [Chryseolinea sp.]